MKAGSSAFPLAVTHGFSPLPFTPSLCLSGWNLGLDFPSSYIANLLATTGSSGYQPNPEHLLMVMMLSGLKTSY